MVMDMLKKMLITKNTRISVQKHFVSDPPNRSRCDYSAIPRTSLKQWLVKIWPLFNVLGDAVIIFALFLGTGPKNICKTATNNYVYVQKGPTGNR